MIILSHISLYLYKVKFTIHNLVFQMFSFVEYFHASSSFVAHIVLLYVLLIVRRMVSMSSSQQSPCVSAFFFLLFFLCQLFSSALLSLSSHDVYNMLKRMVEMLSSLLPSVSAFLFIVTCCLCYSSLSSFLFLSSSFFSSTSLFIFLLQLLINLLIFVIMLRLSFQSLVRFFL